ncbi:hypothetical protein [Vibrio sagamiensis]|uniref:Uncharacterized protein n=1 Tax=Vibrio sagamiensis NBRC 104589 TaxID=1219064 RepID=A0A511QCJ8_9VIBR|nr:hypothetical protein [Vibrio sagamiensis]PNQ54191.1 hypothetical protein C1141_17190 [Vibrio agarivorans]GEM75020.1 hypothetical protein VSA01S_11320 [Vibrio sagamiensis NBRC 104589]
MRTFQQSTLSVPSAHRCIQSSPGQWNLPLEHCLFGVPQNDAFGWTALNQMPNQLKGIYFYLGGECVQLVSDFVNSYYPQHIEKLVIGNSSFAIGKHQNYTELVNKVSVARFPNLKILDLGVWQLFSNSHCMYGQLGDITKILNNSPKIERLGLYGNFELTEAVNFECLKSITVTLEDFVTGSNGGFISHSTLNKLLESDYPALEEAYIDLNCDDDQYGYRFPDTFLEGKNLPKLKKLEITGGFLNGEKERLLQSPIGMRNDLIYHLEDIT